MKSGNTFKTGRKYLSFLLISMVTVTVLWSVSCKKKPLKKIRFGLSWIHQAQFCGNYYADKHGLYSSEGLNVSLIPAEIDKDPLDRLIQGEFDFVLAQPESLIKYRAAGIRIKAIAAVYQIHPLVFISLKGSNIKTPYDFRNKKIGVAYSEEMMLINLLNTLKITREEVTLYRRSYNLSDLTSGIIDIQGAWLTDEVLTARQNEIPINIIVPYDYGITCYADVIVTTEEMIEKQSETVLQFLKATIEGWNNALKDVDKAHLLPLLYNNKLDREHEYQVLLSSVPLIYTGEHPIGWMDNETWQSILDTMQQQNLTPRPVASDHLYTTIFLEQIYR